MYGGTGGSTAIGLSASSSFVPTVVAGTATPPSVVPLPSATTTFGCVGHELEQVCAPAIPEAIVGVVGRLEQLSPSNAYELRVDSIELGTAPPSTASCYWTSEPSCVRHTATTPVGADGG